MSLAELRQAALAVIIGNPLFTPEEQLRANHDIHESEDVGILEAWLCVTRQLDVERSHQARWKAARTLPQPGVSLDLAAQQAEMQALLHCRALHPHQKWAVAHIAGNYAAAATTRLRYLGDSYELVLDNLGRSHSPRRGYAALFDN